MSAIGQLWDELTEGEQVEAIVFGPWGWGAAPAPGQKWDRADDEPNPPPVPFEFRGKPLTWAEAIPFMGNWNFDNDYFDTPRCYATYIWTNFRILWVTQYNGVTWLSSAPRVPTATMPVISGG